MKRRVRMSMTRYLLPAGKTIKKMEREVFTGHFFDDYLSALLGRASAAVAAEFNADIKRRGMPVLTWRVLATLSDSDGMTISDLAEITVTKQPTTTRLVQRLQKQDSSAKRPTQRIDGLCACLLQRVVWTRSGS